MIIHLYNKKGESIRITSGRWDELLNIARRNGWEPLGTEPSEEHLRQRYKNPEGGYDAVEVRKAMESWDGSYRTKDGQSISYADALNFAFALEDAKRKGREGLDEIIRFCKRGAFSIT
jgi:hypothetical protein